ncbi:histidine phosphatase family protein [Leucobacter sp. 7(1)]|uniref:histidine phosphatase family protein n=1 Tax=Leucobacter sp. 7(1) TaxID=1255613 RepID=UPI000B34BCE2|nr:histidine phosphatase family protein [Leucobacter sp. 7(1)]
MTVPSSTPFGSAGSAARHIAVVRHGETDWNLAGRIQGRTEIPLNDTGRAQAAETATALARAAGSLGPWAGLFASPLSRASETAEIIGRGLALPGPRIDEELWERDFGAAEGVCVPEAHERWPGLEIPDAESIDALAARTAGAFSRILAEAPGSIVVAHGAMIRAGLGRLTSTPMPRITNGEVWILSRSQGPNDSVPQHAAIRLDALGVLSAEEPRDPNMETAV